MCVPWFVSHVHFTSCLCVSTVQALYSHQFSLLPWSVTFISCAYTPLCTHSCCFVSACVGLCSAFRLLSLPGLLIAVVSSYHACLPYITCMLRGNFHFSVLFRYVRLVCSQVTCYRYTERSVLGVSVSLWCTCVCGVLWGQCPCRVQTHPFWYIWEFYNFRV